MAGIFGLRDKFKKQADSEDQYFEEGDEDSYVEIEGDQRKELKNKVVVRPFIINDFGDIKEALDALREGYTIALVNIKPLKEKDLVELKRAVNKLKKTTDAIDGDIAGFGDDWIVVTPSFASVHRTAQTEVLEEE
tara:strand:+ start:1829 stop:2233 length:405 start_codon:yes stop_codon:yes gene_type:complete